MTRPTPTFGEYARGRRERLGLTQAALARMAGLPQSRISRLEGGLIPSPSADTVARVAAALRLDPSKALNTFVPPQMTPLEGELPVARLTDAVRAAGAEAGGCSWTVAEDMFHAMASAAGLLVTEALPAHLIPHDALPDDEDDETIAGDPCS